MEKLSKRIKRYFGFPDDNPWLLEIIDLETRVESYCHDCPISDLDSSINDLIEKWRNEPQNSPFFKTRDGLICAEELENTAKAVKRH